MARTITVKPNQSMINVVVQATGSTNACMQFCRDNNVSITDLPTPGTVYVVSDAAIAKAGVAGAAVVKYYAERGIVIGTLAASYPIRILATEDGEMLTTEDGELIEID